jgi:hypothetical protein
MSIFDTFIAKRQTLSEFCDHRAVSARLLEEHYCHYDAINKHMAQFSQYLMPRSAQPTGRLAEAIKELDRSYWRRAFDHTGLMQILDATQRQKFERELSENHTEFTLQNVQDIFLTFCQQADEMFNRGVIQVFERLSSEYARHDSFKMTEKIILSGYIEPRFSRGLQIRSGWYADTINDVDRVLKSLDGKKHMPRTLENEMNNSFQHGDIYAGEYVTAKAYKNGNIHLTFNRNDLVDKINKIIAGKYGATVGSRN